MVSARSFAANKALDLVAREVVRELPGRVLHEVRRDAEQRAAKAPIACHAAAADRVDDAARRVRAVLHREPQLELDLGALPKPRPSMRRKQTLLSLLPWDVVARPDVEFWLSAGARGRIALHRLGLRSRLEPCRSRLSMFRKSVLPPVLSWYMRSSWMPRSAKSLASMRWTMVAPSCDLMSSPTTGMRRRANSSAHCGSETMKAGMQLMKRDPRLEARVSVVLGRLLAADRQVVDHDLGAARAQDLERRRRGGARRRQKRLLGRVVAHVLGDAVEDRPHLHDAACSAGSFG